MAAHAHGSGRRGLEHGEPQGLLIRTINDAPQAWSAMWRAQARMGMIP
jgi:hypothetical protein